MSDVLAGRIRDLVAELRCPGEGDQDFTEDPVSCIVDALDAILAEHDASNQQVGGGRSERP